MASPLGCLARPASRSSSVWRVHPQDAGDSLHLGEPTVQCQKLRVVGVAIAKRNIEHDISAHVNVHVYMHKSYIYTLAIKNLLFLGRYEKTRLF